MMFLGIKKTVNNWLPGKALCKGRDFQGKKLPFMFHKLTKLIPEGRLRQD